MLLSVLLLPDHLPIPLPLAEKRQPEGTRQRFVLLHTHSTPVRMALVRVWNIPELQ